MKAVTIFYVLNSLLIANEFGSQKATAAEPLRDLFTDTWVATDALGRSLPLADEVGPPRSDRKVGMFYFLWLGRHIQGGPFDVTKILAADPDAMQKPDSPLWGSLHAPHHWGESIFGYYLTSDESVLRKHAQMLSDAGVAVVIFDVTNQLTYHDDYMTLLKVWNQMRAAGNRTPQVAFLTPFWDPPKVVRKLWDDLYSKGLFRDLWFQWQGKPLILADPDLIDSLEDHSEQNTPTEILPGHTLGQRFTTDKPFRGAAGRFPTWSQKQSAVTITLFRNGPEGERLASSRFENVPDNGWMLVKLDAPQPPGTYYLEASAPSGKIGWWSDTNDTQPHGQAMADGKPVDGDRTLRLTLADDEANEIHNFFTFRKPQPDYFKGPTQSNMWSWLEVYPQHVFTNSAGAKEQMSVGVAQNAVGNRLGSMSEKDAKGRSWHDGARDSRPNAVAYGFNFDEQWRHALAVDPQFVFVTGWNEWIAGRFNEFAGVREPVMFVDEFDEEHSRDIEPMQGGHGDDYYYQLIANIRRYKGARAVQPIQPKPIAIDGQFEDWRNVEPEFRDTIGDPVKRNHRGWDPKVIYQNDTGRNDLVTAKVSFDANEVKFYAASRERLTPPTDKNWMLLFLDVDGDATDGWLGYDFVVNLGESGKLQRHTGDGFQWEPVGNITWKFAGNQIELSIPWHDLGLAEPPSSLDFKWADNIQPTGDWSDFTLNGDVAPNDRFNYRAVFHRPETKPSGR
ncbi:hypothetical protein GC207_07170 [bacterium]|nr:hypothetical protein [bacterium]